MDNRKTEDPKFRDLVVKKSNDFIVGKYKSSLLEQKLVAIAVTRIRISKSGAITATIFPTELKEMLGRDKDDVHIYRDLKKVSKEMTGHVIELEDHHGNFSFFSFITNADYKNGRFTMTFNNVMADHITNLKSHFTSYSLANSLQLQNGYSFRFYELIKMDAYKVTKDTPVVVHSYNLSELKFMIGVLDIEDPKAKAVQDAGGSWDDMAEACAEHRMARWSSFRERVLDKAKKELDEVADYSFDYNLVKSGAGGKVVGVDLLIHRNDSLGTTAKEKLQKKEGVVENRNQAYENMDIEELTPLPGVLHTYVGHNGLTETDLRSIFEASSYNATEAIKAIEAVDESGSWNTDRMYAGLVADRARAAEGRIPRELIRYVGHNELKLKDIEYFIDDADNDPALVEKAIRRADSQSGMKNYVGWIRACIRKGGYDDDTPVASGSSVIGREVEQINRDLADPKVQEEMCAHYWNKAKTGRTDIFNEFVGYLEENGVSLRMFEAVNTQAECGDKFMDWIKGEKIELI